MNTPTPSPIRIQPALLPRQTFLLTGYAAKVRLMGTFFTFLFLVAGQVAGQAADLLGTNLPIQITPAIMQGRLSHLNPEVYPVIFMLDGSYRLTSVRAVAVADAKTNQWPKAVWHMVSDSETNLTKRFSYGMLIRGMKPVEPTHRPKPLQPEVVYRLLIEAGDRKGQVDFKTVSIIKP